MSLSFSKNLLHFKIMMKKFLLSTSLFAVIILGGCSVEDDVASIEHKTLREMVFTASSGEELTRTAFQVDETSIWWSPRDSISIFYGASDGSKFIANNEEEVARAEFHGVLNVFTGEAEAGVAYNFWAVYPYTSAISCDGNSVVAELNDYQVAKAGSFAPNTNISIAKSSGLNLSFYNTCSWFRFTVTKKGIKRVIFRGNNDEDIAGVFRVSMGDDGRPTSPEVIEGKKIISFSLPNYDDFEVGKMYYITLLPQVFVNGFTVTFETETETGSRSIDVKATYLRSKYNTGVEFDKNIDYSYVDNRWSVLSTYSGSSETQRQWCIVEDHNFLYSLGIYGIRAFSLADKSNPELAFYNSGPSSNNKWARGLTVKDDILYVSTRQASGGKNELFVPDYRFRFEGGISDFNHNLGEFDNYSNTGGVTADENGTPDNNYGTHSLRIRSSANVNQNSCVVLEKHGDNVADQAYSSLWLKVNATGNQAFSIPLRRNDDSDVLFLNITPNSNQSYSISLSNQTQVYQTPVFTIGEWYCFKIYTNMSSSKLWWRTKECKDWVLMQEGSGIAKFDAIAVGMRTGDPNCSIQIDDYYCHSSEIDNVSYVNGSLEVLDRSLNTIQKLKSDIKFVNCKSLDNIMVVSGIGGFNVYDISVVEDPILLSSYRESFHNEYQGFDLYKIDNKTYVCFANYTTGISIWDITDPTQPALKKRFSHNGLNIDGFTISNTEMYTFDLLVDYPYVYSTFAVDGPSTATANDCRGIIVYNISNLNNIETKLFPMDSKDWFTQNTDDFQPTVIKKSGGTLYINAAENGIANYTILDNGSLRYNGLINQGLGAIKAFDVSNGYLYVGKAYRDTWTCLKNTLIDN